MPLLAPIAEAVFAWLHLLACGIAAGLLLTEYWLCRRVLDRQQVRLLATVDLAYWLALIASLATGLARSFFAPLGPAWYLSNTLFLLKIVLFVAIGLLALAPAMQYQRWNREARAAPVFAPLTRELMRVRASIVFGLGLWLVLPLVSILVARSQSLP